MQTKEKDHAEENTKVSPDANSNMEKDPDQWVSGDEPMPGAQKSEDAFRTSA